MRHPYAGFDSLRFLFRHSDLDAEALNERDGEESDLKHDVAKDDLTLSPRPDLCVKKTDLETNA